MSAEPTRDSEITTKSVRRPGRKSIFAWTPFLLVGMLLSFLAAPTIAAAFSVESFTTTAWNADGTIDVYAGTHPFALEVQASVDADQAEESEDSLDGIQVSLPPGLVGIGPDVPRCPVPFLRSCPGSSQVGVLRGIASGLGELFAPLYNVTPET